MGGFQVELWVSVPQPDPAVRVEVVAAALVEELEANGYIEIDGEGDRSFSLESLGERWVELLDQKSQAQDGTHVDLARRLSKALGQPVVTFVVHDGDLCQFELFARGRQRDRWSSDPSYFAEPPEEARRWKGSPKIWERVLQVEGLAKVLEDVFADHDGQRAEMKMRSMLGMERAPPPPRALGRRGLEQEIESALETREPFAVNMVFEHFDWPHLAYDELERMMEAPRKDAVRLIADAAFERVRELCASAPAPASRQLALIELRDTDRDELDDDF